MQHDLIDRLRRINRIPLTPIVANRVREDAPRAIEGGGRDGTPHFGVALEPVLGVLVPEVKRAVGAGGAEGAVHGVEVDGVDGVDVGLVAGVGGGLAVAFEGEVGARRGVSRMYARGKGTWGRGKVPGVFVFDVLDGAAAFYASDRKARGVGEAGDDSGLPFQRALQGLVEFGGLVEADDVDVAIRGADDEELIPRVHAVDSLLAVDRCYWGGLP